MSPWSWQVTSQAAGAGPPSLLHSRANCSWVVLGASHPLLLLSSIGQKRGGPWESVPPQDLLPGVKVPFRSALQDSAFSTCGHDLHDPRRAKDVPCPPHPPPQQACTSWGGPPLRPPPATPRAHGGSRGGWHPLWSSRTIQNPGHATSL